MEKNTTQPGGEMQEFVNDPKQPEATPPVTEGEATEETVTTPPASGEEEVTTEENPAEETVTTEDGTDNSGDAENAETTTSGEGTEDTNGE